uniref:Putative ribonucleasep/mrp protein subunit pop1 n=1 Tax=Lutzomyia longipalpis TaxID=7200 RepID=A0A1B0CL73_LUTLO
MDSSCGGQFDATIGGHVSIPETEYTFQYAEGRLPELASLIGTVRNPTKNKLIFQSIPRHMRRRTAAQNPKRLPMRFRQGHISQLKKSGTPTEKKRPSRKYRRRPRNLRAEYARRQRDVAWLETHIWHAKRFHMSTKWGYRIPWAPCDKSYRACYRATKSHCLVQDISIYACFELRGPLVELTQLKALCNPTELSFIAKCFLSGQREGNVDVFRCNEYPFGAIGRVSFIWKPPGREDQRCLWIFAHPAFAEEIHKQIRDLFALSEASAMELDDQEAPTSNKLHRNASGSIEMRDLTKKLCRFRLTGPLSHAILSKALKCKLNPQIDSTDFTLEAHESQIKYWKEISTIKSPAELAPGMILGLTVEDPRINRPEKRSKALPEDHLCGLIEKIPNQGCLSAIWDENLRNNLAENILNTQKYNEKRQKECLIPGQRCKFEDDLQGVPVLLVQRPGVQVQNKPLGFACGWDVILPACYATIMWISFIMWGARAGGWRDAISTSREMGQDTFAPDTEAGKREAVTSGDEQKEQFFRKPPKKRPNFTKLSIASPFHCPWEQLLQEWSTGSPTSSFYILRDRKILEQCQKALKYQLNIQEILLPDCTLIPIQILLNSRGNPGNNAILTLPQPQDIEKKQSGHHEPLHIEPPARDIHEKARKMLRQHHKKFLKHQRRLRVNRKRKEQEKSTQRVKIPREKSPLVVAACTSYREKMRNMWLPENPTSIKEQCSRRVIGYATQSDFTFTDSKVSAIGYVTWNGFRELIDTCRKWKQVTILVRGTTSLHYRGGSIAVRQQ